jgi:Domain of unknown function (DUF4386)
MAQDSAATPTDRASPRLKARMAGAFYLLTFLTAGITVAVSGGIIVPGNSAVTAAHILAHESRFWLGFTLNLVVIACYVAVTALFYGLFEPVSRTLSRVAALFSLIGCAIQASAFLFYIAPMAVLGRAPYLSAFNAEQLQALAQLFLQLYSQAYNIGFVFFGFYCLLIGCLIVRSIFLPKILGALMMLGGLSWLTFLFPPLASSLRPYNLAPGILGEAALTIWLVLFGVNAQKWVEQSRSR